MKNPKLILLAIAFTTFALLGAALYLQFVEQMRPCPWCIIQRYAFAFTGLICLIAAFLPNAARRIGAGLGVLTSLAGAGAAGWLMWIQAHPEVSCGIDPVETALNKIPPAKLLHFLFFADGECTTAYPPLLGLSIPQWSFFWFVVFAIVLGWVIIKRNR